MDEKEFFAKYRELLTPKEPINYKYAGDTFCPNCHSDEFLRNPDFAFNQFCGACGQRIHWSAWYDLDD